MLQRSPPSALAGRAGGASFFGVPEGGWREGGGGMEGWTPGLGGARLPNLVSVSCIFTSLRRRFCQAVSILTSIASPPPPSHDRPGRLFFSLPPLELAPGPYEFPRRVFSGVPESNSTRRCMHSNARTCVQRPGALLQGPAGAHCRCRCNWGLLVPSSSRREDRRPHVSFSRSHQGRANIVTLRLLPV